MGKSSAKMEVTQYFMSVHFGICSGPTDALLGVTVKEKTAWTGAQSDAGSFTLSNMKLFGGVKKEGGVDGAVHYLPGSSDQVLPDALAARLGRGTGPNAPGYRGLASLFFVGGGADISKGRAGYYWTANNPYLPGVWATVQRIFKREDGLEQWYAAKAAIQGPTTASPPAVIFSKGSTAWKWKRVSISDGADYSAAAYDDTAWASGTAPFIDQGYPEVVPGGFSSAMGTDIGLGTDAKIWLRRSFSVSALGAFTLTYFHDDGSSLWVNGTLIQTRSAKGLSTVEIPAGVVRLGSNQISLCVTNTIATGPGGGWIYADAELVLGDRSAGYDMNPAHIIREALTNTAWGMGSPESALNDDSFTAAADRLFEENFGLSLMWTRQSTIEDFISEILDHIQAVLFVDPATGLLTLKLIRDDYDPDTLPVLTPDNADVTKFDRKLWGEIINEIIVTWTNPQNEQEETVTVQDLASIAMQGGNIVSASRNYYGVRNANLATQLGRRDLRTVGAPLCSAEVEIDRSAYALRPASVIKLTWPEHGLDEIIMRVMSIDYGRPGDMTIRATLMEDVFSLDAGAYVDPIGSEWEDPSAAPEPITEARVITLPAFLAADAIASNGGSDPVYPEVVGGILATTGNTDTFSYELNTELPLPDGSLQWTAIGENNIIGRGTLVAPLPAEAATTGITVTGFTGQTAPTQGGFALIGDSTNDETTMEVAMVTDFDGSTGEFSLARGVMDTVPRAWAAGTQVWFVDGETLFEDRQVRSAGETVEYKLLTQTSQGQLDLTAAPLLTGTMTERPWLPLRPANVRVNDVGFQAPGEEVNADGIDLISVTWSNRNRLTEDSQILLWTDATVTPEAGQTTTIEVLDPSDRSVVATHTGLPGTSFDLPAASFGTLGLGIVRITSELDGFASLQGHELRVRVMTGYGLNYGRNYGGA